MVLGGLAVLTAVFAVSTSLSLSRLQVRRADYVLSLTQQTYRDILQQVIWKCAEAPCPSTMTFTQMGGGYTVTLVDVGGLIDLNTVSPALLERLYDDLGIDAAQAKRFRDWRRMPHRLLRVSDFARLTGLPMEQWERLGQVATVYSGRTGIAPDVAPLAVLQIAAGPDGSLDTLKESVPPEFRTAPSGTNFQVLVDRAGQRLVLIGAVHLPAGSNAGRVLWMK